jgi:hypothetical protein
MPHELELALSGDDLNEERWGEILSAPGLRKLVIWGGSVTTQDMARLSGLKSLTKLVLGEMKIDDGIFAYLRPLENLECLILAYTDVCRGFDALAGPPLREVLLEGSPRVGDEAMAELATWPKLRHVEAHITAVTDAGVASIAKLPLEVLWLGPRITDRALETIAGVPTLRHLDLCAHGVTDAGVRRLAGLPNLQILWLSNTSITDASVEVLAGMGTLRELALGGTKMTAGGKARLAVALPNCSFAPEPA